MRNLQKILALVLALIMSFSLVATAGAFSDDGDISDAYKDAVTVLNGLEVFKGYDNGATFQPKGNITRAEVAAIIYRIATGDVKDTQASIYSTYGQFTDVLDGSWYAGYVNYCANAGYIKGRGNKIFDPQATVTGYEALAMILRAVGYDKNGEFTGSNWQIRTASIANERGISKNVTSAMLGQAATREVVAELLFRSIIIPKVNFNANTLSYTEKPLNADGKKDTLGYESLKLEEITGIVTANEYADLEKSITLNDGKTRMRVDGVDGQDYILDYTEENLLDGLDAIGEEHNAYIQNANTTSAKVFVMTKTDNNKTYETLEEVEIDTDSKFREKTGFQRSASATEDFLNFDEVNEWHSDWRIKYVVSSVDSVVRGDVETQIKRINTLTNFELPSTLGAELATPLTFANGYRLIQDGTTDKYFIEYTKEFRIDEVINSIHRGNIEEIFNIADKLNNGYVRGEVYVGTSSMKDISDEISFKQFVEQYIDNTEAKITDNENGNWLKVIDNDNDGQAEYVLKIVYTMAQVVRAKDGKYGLDTEDVVLCNSKKGADDAVNFIDDDDVRSEDTLALDDIVYYAVIDDKAWATKAEIANVKIDVVNRKDLKVTTTDGTEYVESGVCEEIVSNDYNSGVTNMNGSATYDIYLDRGGFLAAFTDSNGGDFTLIVDGWYNNTKNGVEYAVRAYNDETNRQDMIDVTRGGSMFIGDVQWDKHNVQNNAWNALKWLGGVTAAKANDGALDNNPAGQLNGESGIQANEDVKTTVATLTGDGMLLPVDYASTGTARTDKVVRMLAPKNNAIPTSAASYNAEVYRTSDSLGITDTAYDAADGTAELRALSSTTYYLVYPSGNAESGFVVERYVGYANVPSIDDGFVEDVYAVGTRQNRVSTLGADSYFTANVVVVELNANYRGKQEQVFIYNMPEAGSRVGIESVDLIRENGKLETVKIDFNASNIRDYRVALPATTGWATWWGPGLYFLYTTSTEGLYTVQPMSAADIAANDYVVGWSATAQGTLKNDYVSVVAFDENNNTYGLVEKSAAKSGIYTLEYNNSGIATLDSHEATAGNIQRYLGERTDVNAGSDYSPYDHTPLDGHDCRDNWNQNRVLIHYDGNNALYAISFSNKVNSNARLAEAVWRNNRPSASAWSKNYDSILNFVKFVVEDYRGETDIDDYDNVFTWANIWGNAEAALKGLPYNSLSASQKATYDRLIKAFGGVYDHTVTVEFVNDATGEIVATATANVKAGENANVAFTEEILGKYTVLRAEPADALNADKTAVVLNNVTADAAVKVYLEEIQVLETLEVINGEETTVDPSLVGKTVTLIVKDDSITANGWYHVTGGNLSDTCAANADANGVLKFPYTIDAEKFTITAAQEPFFTGVGGAPSQFGSDENGNIILVTYEWLNKPTTQRSRAAAGDVATGERGSLIAMKLGDAELYFVFEDGKYILRTDKTADELNAALAGCSVDDNGLYQVSVAPDEATTNGDASVKKTEGANTVVNFDLGQPKAVGAKLPETVTIDGQVTASVKWFYNGQEIDPATDDIYAKDTEGYTYEIVQPVVNDETLFPVDIIASEETADQKVTVENKEDLAEVVVTPDEVTVAPQPSEAKLNVESVADKYLIKFSSDSGNSGKYAFEIQDPLTVTKAADGKTINVSGVSKYVSSWTDWGNSEGAYYIALQISCPGVSTQNILFKSVDGWDKPGPGEGYKPLGTADGTTAAGDEYAVLVWKLSDDDKGVRKNIDVKVGNETFVIDLSGVKTGADNEVLKVEAVGAQEQISETTNSGAKDYGKKGGDIQNITVGELSGNTIKVTGTTKYIGRKDEEGNLVGWTEYAASNNTGFFVALKISYPGIKPTEIKGIYGEREKGLSTDTDAKAGEAGLALIRLDNNELGLRKNFTVEVAGKRYIVDLSGVTTGDAADVLSVTPVGADEIVLGKKGSELQEITASGTNNDIKIAGKLKYVPSYEGWSEGAKGYFIALHVEHSGVLAYDEIKLLPSNGGNGVALGSEGDGPENANVIVKKIDPKDKKTQSVKLEVKGVVYTIDLAGVEFEDKLDVTAFTGAMSEPWDSVEVSQVNNIDVVRDGETFKVTGEAYYVDPMAGFGDGDLAKGYYITLDFKTDGTEITVKGQESADVTLSDNDMIRRLYVDSRGQVKNISVEAFGKDFTIDVSELKLVDKFTLKETEETTLIGKPTGELQNGLTVTVDEATKTWKIAGDVKYVTKWEGAYSDEQAKGWFVALDWEYLTGGIMEWYSDLLASSPRKLGKGDGSDDNNISGTIVTRIAGTDMEIKNVKVVTGSGDEWTVDFQGVTLLGPDGTPITPASAMALDLDFGTADFAEF